MMEVCKGKRILGLLISFARVMLTSAAKANIRARQTSAFSAMQEGAIEQQPLSESAVLS